MRIRLNRKVWVYSLLAVAAITIAVVAGVELLDFQHAQTRYSRLKTAYIQLMKYHETHGQFPPIETEVDNNAEASPLGWRYELCRCSSDSRSRQSTHHDDSVALFDNSIFAPSTKERMSRNWVLMAVCDEKGSWLVESDIVKARQKGSTSDRHWNPALIVLVEFARPGDVPWGSDVAVTTKGILLFGANGERMPIRATHAYIHRLLGGVESVDLSSKNNGIQNQMIFD